MPAETVRSHQSAGPERASESEPLPADRRMGRNEGEAAIAAELKGLPENTQWWQKLDARASVHRSRSARSGTAVHHGDATAAPRKCISSSLTSLFCHMSLRQSGGPDAGRDADFYAAILTKHPRNSKTSRDVFGVSVSNLRIWELDREHEATCARRKAFSRGVIQAAGRLRERSRFFLWSLPPGEGRAAFTDRDGFC